MEDVQNSYDDRNIPIQKVGVKGLQYPVTVLDRQNKSQHTTATVHMYVDLPHHFKGTHMSRFVEILNEHHGRISVREIDGILSNMLDKLGCEVAHIELRFPYFIEKTAVASKAKSLMNYDCAFLASAKRQDGGIETDLVVEAGVPVSMVCPCSKEISDRGAHNQRSTITIRVRSNEFVWLEEIIEIAESSASSPVYSLLKRSDEKVITEQAYDRPRFAEDAVRIVAEKLNQDPRITWYSVESENQESIHNHNAYAFVESTCS
ncbi:MAG: GTP cyclohydrolase I FolE2 [Kiritimatiellae bacterium]|nr:GTP cyclohydrolase I FolE2 [Kiritimatiellia bacterium]